MAFCQAGGAGTIGGAGFCVRMAMRTMTSSRTVMPSIIWIEVSGRSGLPFGK